LEVFKKTTGLLLEVLLAGAAPEICVAAGDLAEASLAVEAASERRLMVSMEFCWPEICHR